MGTHMLMAATRMHLFAKNGNKAMVMKRAVQASLFYSPSRVGGVYTVSKRFNSSRSEGETLELSSSAPSFAPSPSSSLWERVKNRTGLSTLLPEWKLMFSKEDLLNDLTAGVTVGCVAVPLSLAIALASGVSPEIGLVSAIVGGTVACLFGGAPLGVTGPSLATTVLLSSVASTHGISALVFVTCVTGALQMLSGVARLGRLVQFVPQPVIAGFTAGVGGVMLIGQMPRVLGVVSPAIPGIFEMAHHVVAHASHIQPASLLLSLGTLATTIILPKFFPKVPASLVAVAIAAGLNAVLGLGAPVIGTIPCSFPTPSLPSFPDFSTMYSLMGASLTLYGLTSLESLLSGSAADKIDKNDLRKHEPNLELVGQGMSNMAVACFGGIPVTGAIARTSLNITSGAKTRRASMFHVCILGGVFAISPIVGLIPLSALSGILLSVAFRLLNPKELKFLSKVSYREVIPLATTFCTILAGDLVSGVQVGVVTALALQVTKKLPKRLSFSSNDNVTFKLDGDVTFISASRLGNLQATLENLEIRADRQVTLDFESVGAIDSTAGEMLVDMITYLEEMGHTPETLKLANLLFEHKRVIGLCDSRNIVLKFLPRTIEGHAAPCQQHRQL